MSEARTECDRYVRERADFFEEETLKRLEENKSEGSRMLEQKLEDAELKETNEELDSIPKAKETIKKDSKVKKKKDSTPNKKSSKKVAFVDPNLTRTAKERDSITVTTLQNQKASDRIKKNK